MVEKSMKPGGDEWPPFGAWFRVSCYTVVGLSSANVTSVIFLMMQLLLMRHTTRHLHFCQGIIIIIIVRPTEEFTTKEIQKKLFIN